MHSSLQVLPYRALLKAGRPEERKKMVMALYESPRAEATAVLLSALQDPDESIRLLAAQALEKHSQKFQRAIQEQRTKISVEPKNPHLRVELANLLYEQALRSSLSGETHRSGISEAIDLINSALPQLSSENVDSARFRLAELLAKLSRYSDARLMAQTIAPLSPLYPKARFLMAEMSLALGDWEICKTEMKSLSHLPLINGIKSAVSYWEPQS